MNYAVVDIETTGLFHQGHGITEIAVVHVDGAIVRTAFHSMVKPERSIPAGITQLTGISHDMVLEAPSFEEILPAFLESIKGRILVAHHVNFDFQFLKANAEKYGKAIKNKRLCTLKLARKVSPGAASYKLGSLCSKYGIENRAPHRATGDALATAELLLNLIDQDNVGHVDTLLGRAANESVLPAHLSREHVEALPESPGVYYFYGQDKRPIYIGKAKNLRRRVLSHFTGAGSTRKKQLFQREIHSLSHTETPTEYQAWLLEDAEIKAHWPRYNTAQKDRVKVYAAALYKDRAGVDRIGIVPARQATEPIAWFGSQGGARDWLQSAAIEYGWNPKRAGLFSEGFSSMEPSLEQRHFKEFIERTREMATASYILSEPAIEGLHPFVLVQGGRYRGFGASHDLRTFDPDHLHRAPESSTARSIVRKMLNDQNVRMHPL